nr:MAG TPA: hypothetical protein [Caudoviricetes sp.]
MVYTILYPSDCGKLHVLFSCLTSPYLKFINLYLDYIRLQSIHSIFNLICLVDFL